MPWFSWYFSVMISTNIPPWSPTLIQTPHSIISLSHKRPTTFTHSCMHWLNSYKLQLLHSWTFQIASLTQDSQPHLLHTSWLCFFQIIEFNNNIPYIKPIAKMTHSFTLVLEFNKTIQESDLFGSTKLYLLWRLDLGLIPSSMPPITIIGIGVSKSLLLCFAKIIYV